MHNIINVNTELHKKFYKNITYLQQNQPLQYITIAISGGQDSLCLIKLIQDFKILHEPLLKIDYIYIDHQWKIDSKHQIKHIINLLNKYKESYLFIYQIKHSCLSENQARKLRYQVLINHSIKVCNNIILTAHTETDQVETFWQQLIRGTNIDGATSLINHRNLTINIQLWRPLINFTRSEINWFCRKFYLPIWSDMTNYTYYISRNRLRYELLPYLKQYFNNDVDRHIHHFIKNTHIDNEYIKQNTIKLYLISRHPTSLAINHELIRKQHKALQIRVLQFFFFHNLNKLLTYRNLSDLVHISQQYNTFTYKNNIKIFICHKWLYIS